MCAITCTICLIYKPSQFTRWFVLFLWITVTIELVGKLISSFPLYKFPMYNIFNGIEFTFYLFFIANFIEKKITKKIILLFSYLFILFFFTNLSLIQGLYMYNTITHTIGSIILLLAILMTFYEISSSETMHYINTKWPLLLITFGLLFFYSGNLLNTAILNYISEREPEKAVSLYKSINRNLNFFLYLSFAIAFVLDLIKQLKSSNLEN